jgi:hypothetical protein
LTYTSAWKYGVVLVGQQVIDLRGSLFWVWDASRARRVQFGGILLVEPGSCYPTLGHNSFLNFQAIFTAR